MKLTFYGGAGDVTGANYLLESGTGKNATKILVDCGLHQGSNFSERQNFESFPYNPAEVDAVFVTHPHIDHVGRLPSLYRAGFRGKIFSTAPGKDFAELLLIDSEHILREEASRFKKPPLYTIEDIQTLMRYWHPVEYHTTVQVGPLTAEFRSAGHILGSSFVVIKIEGKTIVFSGDLGNSPAPMIGPREAPPEEVDYCLVESTYGGRVHEPMEERKGVLEDMIEDTVRSSGVLMIPAFAMERTQQLLFELNELVENGRIPKVPIFIDSPLAIKVTEVYKKYTRYFDEPTKKLIESGDSIFNFKGLKMTLTTEESKAINDVPPPKVVIAGAGMSNAGRILHHERRYLSDPRSMLFMVGYQSKGSLGRQILDGAKTVRILGEEVSVRAKIRAVGGFSAHADQPQIVEWLRPMRQSLKKLFIVQGEEDQALALEQKIRDELAISTVIPRTTDSFEL